VKHIIVLMTCHNRREKTLACLTALFANALPAELTLAVVLVDDGSTDGTAAAVRQAFPAIQLVAGSGSMYWNGGMRLAFDTAQAHPYDYLLWLNDDTILDGDAIIRLLATADSLFGRYGRPAIVVGSTRGPGTMRLSYGGSVRLRPRLRPLRFTPVQPGAEPIQCDTMNGNCVLVPTEIAAVLGNLDHRFIHGIGDTDYGLRALAAGYANWVMPGYAGTCANDHVLLGSFLDVRIPMTSRLKKLMSPKGLPLAGWMVLAKRHGGILWPLHGVWPFVSVVATSLSATLRGEVRRPKELR
jgi:GT2 family glycosyltransferase